MQISLTPTTFQFSKSLFTQVLYKFNLQQYPRHGQVVLILLLTDIRFRSLLKSRMANNSYISWNGQMSRENDKNETQKQLVQNFPQKQPLSKRVSCDMYSMSRSDWH